MLPLSTAKIKRIQVSENPGRKVINKQLHLRSRQEMGESLKNMR
jgi:hypothetical protein